MKLKTITWSIGVVFSAAGCASLGEPAGGQNWQLQPQLELSHSASAPEALYRLGRVHQGRIDYDRAMAAYREALELDPTFIDAYNGLGVTYSAQGRYDDAIRALRAAIALAPHLAYLHNNLGYAYLLRGSNEQAIRALEEATRLDPGQPRALQNLQLARSRIGAGPSAANAAPVPPAPALARSDNLIAPLKAEQDRRIRLQVVAPNIFQLAPPSVRAVPIPPAQIKAASANTQQMPRSSPVAADPVPLAQSGSPSADPQWTHEPWRFRLEISNGNGVNGLARRVAQHLKGAALPRIRLTNHLSFNQPASEIQYRQGYAAEADALRSRLQARVAAVTSDRLASNTDVRLVLGSDFRTDTALFMRDEAGVQVGSLTR